MKSDVRKIHQDMEAIMDEMYEAMDNREAE